MPPVTQPARKEEGGADTADDQRGLPASRLARRQGDAAANEENGDQGASREPPCRVPAAAAGDSPIVAAPPSIRNHRIEPLSTPAQHKQRARNAKVVLAAPTGRAAKRLAELTGLGVILVDRHELDVVRLVGLLLTGDMDGWRRTVTTSPAAPG